MRGRSTEKAGDTCLDQGVCGVWHKSDQKGQNCCAESFLPALQGFYVSCYGEHSPHCCGAARGTRCRTGLMGALRKRGLGCVLLRHGDQRSTRDAAADRAVCSKHLFYGCIYSTGVVASVLQVSHRVPAPSSPQMLHTTSTDTFSGPRWVGNLLAQPPHNHPTWFVHAVDEQYNIQLGPRVRRPKEQEGTQIAAEKRQTRSSKFKLPLAMSQQRALLFSPSHKPPSAQAHG